MPCYDAHMDFTLHIKNFTHIPLTGRTIRKHLESRAATIKMATAGLQDPDVSIIIRSRNEGA